MLKSTTPNANSKKINLKLKNSEKKYDLTIFNKEEDDLTFILENVKDFPMKIFEL